jgi:hypothetical protein
MDVLFSLHPFHTVQQEKGKGMAETQKKFFPLPLLGWRVRIFRLNLEPPGPKDKNTVIISHFGGRKNKKPLLPSVTFAGSDESQERAGFARPGVKERALGPGCIFSARVLKNRVPLGTGKTSFPNPYFYRQFHESSPLTARGDEKKIRRWGVRESNLSPRREKNSLPHPESWDRQTQMFLFRQVNR